MNIKDERNPYKTNSEIFEETLNKLNNDLNNVLNHLNHTHIYNNYMNELNALKEGLKKPHECHDFNELAKDALIKLLDTYIMYDSYDYAYDVLDSIYTLNKNNAFFKAYGDSFKKEWEFKNR